MGVGTPVCGSLCLPLLCCDCGEGDRWSPKVLLQSQRCSTILTAQDEGQQPGEHGGHAKPRGSTAYREGSPCLVLTSASTHTHTLLPPCGGNNNKSIILSKQSVNSNHILFVTYIVDNKCTLPVKCLLKGLPGGAVV